MIYCINPDCPNDDRQNPDDLKCCQACGTPLLVKNRYKLVRPLRDLTRSLYIEVFEVDQQGTRKVLKVLKNNDDTLLRLFKREADVLISLKYQGIPQVEPGEYFTLELPSNQGQLHCLVMEKIEGQDLEKYLQEHGAISEKLALNWLEQLAKILHEVHQKKLFHRDIKPSNIMRKPDGQLVLIDFGAARWITDTVVNSMGDMTQVFTPGYAAPEQKKGNAVPQSDFFALGRTFVHLLTGYHPNDFLDSQTGQLNWRHRAPHVSQELADFINQLMAPSVKKRPKDTQSILKICKHLRQKDESTERILFPPVRWIRKRISPVVQSQKRVIVVGLIVTLLLGLCIWKFVTPPPSSTCLGALDVNEMAFSPDGKYIATASLDNTVRVLKPSSNQIISKDSHEDGVIALKFSPDGKKIATASFDAKVGLWEMSTNGKISPLKIWEHPNYVVALAFSPKGNFLATATVGGSIRVLETNDLKEERKRKQYDTYVRAVSFSSDGKYLAIVGRDNKALVWEWQTNKERLQLNDVVAFAFSPKDARYLATADAKGNVKVLDTNNNFEIVNTVNLETYPTAINFSPEGKHLLLLGWNKKAKLWEWETQDKPISLEQDPNEQAIAATFSSKTGKYIATVNTNGTIKIWNNSGTFIKELPQNSNNSLVAVTFNPKDDKQLALTNANGCLQILKWSNFIFGSWVF